VSAGARVLKYQVLRAYAKVRSTVIVYPCVPSGYYHGPPGDVYNVIHDAPTAEWIYGVPDVDPQNSYIYDSPHYRIDRPLVSFDLSAISPPITAISCTLFHPRINNAWASRRACNICGVDGAGIEGQPEGYGIMKDRTTKLFAWPFSGGPSTFYNVSMPFNADGLAWIEAVVGGVAHLGIRIDWDIANAAPNFSDEYQFAYLYKAPFGGYGSMYLIVDFLK
jgi:hypothetical protein